MSHHRSGAAEIDALQDDMDHLQVADAHHPEYVSGDRDGGSSLGSSELEEDDDDDDDVEDEDDAGAEEGSEEETSWIAWFCSLRENDFLCEVDEEYIEDDFNLTGLNTFVPYYDYALDLILDMETPHDQNLTQMQQEMIESAAEMLYGLIHSRYILTTKGMAAMLEKYQNVDFGRCHRVHCQGQPVLPVGQSDVPRHTTVNVFCPKCRDIYFPKSQRAGQIDGAYFGTTFPHVFLMTHSQLVPPPPTQVYVPKIYGFKVHESSEYYTGKKKTSSSSPDRNNSRRGRKRFDRLLRA